MEAQEDNPLDAIHEPDRGIETNQPRLQPAEAGKYPLTAQSLCDPPQWREHSPTQDPQDHPEVILQKLAVEPDEDDKQRRHLPEGRAVIKLEVRDVALLSQEIRRRAAGGVDELTELRPLVLVQIPLLEPRRRHLTKHRLSKGVVRVGCRGHPTEPGGAVRNRAPPLQALVPEVDVGTPDLRQRRPAILQPLLDLVADKRVHDVQQCAPRQHVRRSRPEDEQKHGPHEVLAVEFGRPSLGPLHRRSMNVDDRGIGARPVDGPEEILVSC
mmetsp:Transcript_17310/g.47007  ORF Transcript_17310/g.47007 Transcript_17310/m.47007 type:complete len:269 (-) Transcript_17310:835-1641(-)